MQGTLVKTSYVGDRVYIDWCVETEKGRKHFCTIYTISGVEGGGRRLEHVFVRDCSCHIEEIPEDVLRMVEKQTTNK